MHTACPTELFKLFIEIPRVKTKLSLFPLYVYFFFSRLKCAP